MNPSRMKLQILYYFSISLFVLLMPVAAMAAACTPGTNCYCDRVRSGDLKDTGLLMCEDYEAPTLRSAGPVGGGAPYFGPPYDDTGWPGNRGNNGYWFHNYSVGTNGAQWGLGAPASPLYGSTCAYPVCYGVGIWDAQDRWQANSFARVAILTDSEFSAEIATITKPAGRAGGGSGAFDGAASLGSRVPAGNTVGFFGGKRWSPARTTIGYTMAIAYPNNLLASGVLNAPWKHDEWLDPNAEAIDAISLFHDGAGLTSTFPFYGFLMQNSSYWNDPTACNAALARATATHGSFRCNGIALIWHPTNYNQAADWPLGNWGCVRGYFQNAGLADSSLQIWFTGPSGVEKQVIGISGLDTTTFRVGKGPGYGGIGFNNYVNTNQGGGATPTNQTTFRYVDNFHIRAGEPVSCGQIGFNSTSPAPAPAPEPAPAPAPAPAPVPSVDSTPPTVTINSPANGAIVKTKTLVAISASAQDNLAVAKVEIFVNGALKCTDTAAPYQCDWLVPKKPGRNYSIQAAAYDAAGNGAKSGYIVVQSSR
jgi:hypothetical protein